MRQSSRAIARSIARQRNRAGAAKRLDGKYLLLTTFRRDGRAVGTPVWFAREGERLYVETEATSGKAKRIKRDARVLVSPCTVRGKPRGVAREGHARLLAAPSERRRAEALLAARYGLVRRLFYATLGRAVEKRGGSVYVEIALVAEDARDADRARGEGIAVAA